MGNKLRGGCEMTEKVKLPKDVCDALDKAKAKGFNWFEILENTHHELWHIEEFEILNLQLYGDIMRALVLGYEPELTPEERIKERYKNGFRGDSQGIFRAGIREALQIHGIKYDWLEDYAE